MQVARTGSSVARQRSIATNGVPASGRTPAGHQDRDNKVTAHGVEIDPPEDKPYGVRLTGVVRDPEGYSWGFMRRLPD